MTIRAANSVQNSVRDVLDVIFRHKGKGMLFAAAIVALVVAYTYLVAEIYRSEAKLLLRLGRENLSVDPSVAGPTVGFIQDRDAEVNSELAILTSQEIAGQVVDRFGAEQFLRRPDEDVPTEEWKGTAQEGLRPVRREVRAAEGTAHGLLVALDLAAAQTPRIQAIQKFSNNLVVEVERSSNIILVTFDSQSGQLSRDVLDYTIQLYMDRHIEVHSSQASPAFFESQSLKLEEELKARENALDAYRRQAGIAAIEKQKDVLLQEIADIESKKADSGARVKAMHAEIEVLSRSLGRTTKQVELSRTSGFTNFAADYLKQRLTDMRREETDLAARYAEDYRPLVELRQQIQQIDVALKQEEETHTQVETGVNTNYQTLELALQNCQAELDAEEAQLASISHDLEVSTGRLNQLTEKELEYERLMREKDLAENEFRQYRDSLQRSRISAALDLDKVSNVRVVQKATFPLEPVSPKKIRNVSLGIVAGLVAAVALAFVAQTLDDTLKTDADITRKLRLPVLASVTDQEFKSCK